MAYQFEDLRRELFSPHGYGGCGWQMSLAESSALTVLMQHVRPRRAIEIGTAEGGSLGIISRYSAEVHSIDINPECRKLQASFPNVTFHTGPSTEILPRLFQACRDFDFVLIDGDHSHAGAHHDLKAVIKAIDRHDCHLLLHDSMNPEVRRGILDVDLQNYPHVAYADLDFVPGVLNSVPGWEDTLWGGFAYVRLAVEARSTPLEVAQLCGRQFDRLQAFHYQACQRAAARQVATAPTE